MIQDLSGSCCIKGTGESMTRVDSPVPLMHRDPDRSWITDLDPDHPKGTQPKTSAWVDFGHVLGNTVQGTDRISILSDLDNIPYFSSLLNNKSSKAF